MVDGDIAFAYLFLGFVGCFIVGIVWGIYDCMKSPRCDECGDQLDTRRKRVVTNKDVIVKRKWGPFDSKGLSQERKYYARDTMCLCKNCGKDNVLSRYGDSDHYHGLSWGYSGRKGIECYKCANSWFYCHYCGYSGRLIVN